jgi:ribosome-binding factor A
VKEFDRTERIGAELRRELYQVLRNEVNDPRLAEITVHEVRVARDLAHAKVFFTCFPSDEQATEQARLLNGRLAGFVRHALAQRVRLRTMPQLHFVHDESIGTGERLAALIERVADRPEPELESEPEPELEAEPEAEPVSEPGSERAPGVEPEPQLAAGSESGPARDGLGD